MWFQNELSSLAEVPLYSDHNVCYYLKYTVISNPSPGAKWVRGSATDDTKATVLWFRKVKVKCSRYRPGVAQWVGRDIAVLFHDRGTRRGWVVSSTPRPHFTPGKEPLLILQEAEWAPGPVWTGGKSRPHRDSIPDRPVRSQSLCRLSYRVHRFRQGNWYISVWIRKTN